jgi:hydrogenase maturation protease
MCRVLFIGYGNDLRSDDGAARHAAEIVEEWNLPGVRVISKHQLTPELAEEVAWAKTVIFADSYAAHAGDGCRTVNVSPTKPPETLTHTVQPGMLLWYAQFMYDRCPTAWLMAIPSIDFSLGDGLSPTAQAGVREAANGVREIIERQGRLYGIESACTK